MLLLVALVTPFSSVAPAIGVDAYIGFPARSQLVATTTSASKGIIAWVETLRGVCNVFIASEPRWEATQATTFTDASMDLVGLRFVETTGSLGLLTLAYSLQPHASVNMRANATGNPNACATYVTEVSQDLKRHTVSTDCSSFASIYGDRSDGQIQPNIYALRNSNEVHILKYESNRKPGSSGYCYENIFSLCYKVFGVQQGTIGEVQLSPMDSSLIAFTNPRGHHGFLGLVQRAAYGAQKTVVWVDPSVQTDTAPRWSPDGSMLAWLRVRPPVGDDGYGAFDGDQLNRGPDFEVRVVDIPRNTTALFAAAAAGKLRAVRAILNPRTLFMDEKWGQPTFGYGRRGLWFPTNEAVYFGTESLSDWLHLASVGVDGKSTNATSLQSGPCEDREWMVSSTHAFVSHNCDEIDGRSLVAIELTTGTRTTLVKANKTVVAGMSNSAAGDPNGGIALTSAATGGGYVAWLQSSWNSPAAVNIAPLSDLSKIQRITDDGSYFSTAGLSFVEPESITFPSADGKFTLHGQIFSPTTGGSGGRGMVYTHGGSERQFFAAFHYSPVYAQQYAVNQWLASPANNITVISVNYRSGVGYGPSFRLCDNCMTNGGAEYYDVKSAALFLKEAKKTTVSPTRVGIWGISYGGLNAMQACARDSMTVFHACASTAGILNFISSDRYITDNGVPRFDLDLQPAFPAGFRRLPTGPMPHLAGPGWIEHVARKIEIAWGGSPIAGLVKPDGFTAPLLMIQGDADEEVDFEETIATVRALRTLGLAPETLVVPDESHGLGLYAHQVDAYELSRDFFMRTL